MYLQHTEGHPTPQDYTEKLCHEKNNKKPTKHTSKQKANIYIHKEKNTKHPNLC